MLPDHDLDDLLAAMVARLADNETRIANLERQETPVGSGSGVSLLDEVGYQLLSETGDPLLSE